MCDRSLVAIRKSEVLFFVRVTNFGFRENRSFVAIRNRWFEKPEVSEPMAGSALAALRPA